MSGQVAQASIDHRARRPWRFALGPPARVADRALLGRGRVADRATSEPLVQPARDVQTAARLASSGSPWWRTRLLYALLLIGGVAFALDYGVDGPGLWFRVKIALVGVTVALLIAGTAVLRTAMDAQHVTLFVWLLAIAVGLAAVLAFS